ncbi:putative quinol monooxygenase [Proteiniphilum sp. X52]|uniref:putative quinol monooxygenase n=1 Tax=Proteiniphilum sp. X52 TaxID=2382159 RepID=UPI000F0A70F3|nr:antibiotic biosynthesis monooxygenase [Proteiniphilum sp. X52]RNC65568.1 hypothetical protein D7D25_07185 [Proteiniphilum sp. X52]
MPKIALGTWAWGAGAFGGDAVFGSKTDVENLNIEGCIRYDYFYPADDPEGLLLIDEWTDQEALDRCHSSPVMKEAAALREKYKLGGRQVRMFHPVMPQNNNPEGKKE